MTRYNRYVEIDNFRLFRLNHDAPISLSYSTATQFDGIVALLHGQPQKNTSQRDVTTRCDVIKNDGHEATVVTISGHHLIPMIVHLASTRLRSLSIAALLVRWSKQSVLDGGHTSFLNDGDQRPVYGTLRQFAERRPKTYSTRVRCFITIN